MLPYAFDPDRYAQQLADKVERLQALLRPLGAPSPEVHPSPPSHYRLRAEFRLWHAAGERYYAMFDPANPRQPVRVDQFPVASTTVNRLMAALLDALPRWPRLEQRLFQVDFLSTLSGDALLRLLYHRPLDAAWHEAAGALSAALQTPIIGRARKQREVIGRDYVTETLRVDGRDWHYRQIEGGFTQPNGEVNQHMLAWASGQARGLGGDLLELYCGNGNFSVILAQHFRRVLATEMSKTSVAAAEHNLTANAVHNVALARLASEEVAAALAAERPFRRLQQAGIELADYRFSTVFVDPPRAGLDEATLRLVRGFDHILYISCNPDTLQHNLQSLAGSHAIRSLALFDQFPYTHHIECGALLSRR